ncbi:hypothetical protein L3Y34_008916 [Caenorhabditis briggsae]|uniref:Tetratricopeptide SHNi-TPR domain-containing protein n=1 Tax=Caenorhabditis briggsae TaxID=6238 RepID=A0AAE9A3R1_CAEBR|nr:hypothetical protein L3Y34_008916 [Caenorhabditis briggsae]
MEEAAEELSPEEKQKKYTEQLIAGRRFMKTNVFDKATEALSLAAALGAEIFGEAHEETFDANFLYGKALLELSKIEDEVLTNALTDMPKEEEREEIKQQVEEALGVAAEKPETIEEEMMEATETEKKDEETVDETKEEVAAAADSTETEDDEMEAVEEEGAEEQDPEAEQAEDGAEDDDDEEPIKLAWELLETSRCICEKKLKSLEGEENADAVKVWKLNQADVLTSLGEHGIVDSKYEQAQKDLAEAVAIQSALLPATSRILANTTHLLAKSFSLDSIFEKAATHFCESKNILIAKVEELKKQLETVAENEKSDIEVEIEELEAVIPELDAFVIDARASAEQTEKLKETVKKDLEEVAANISKLSGEETKDITNMVRRPTKRPASEEPAEVSKKRKSEEGAATVPDEKAMETTEESESATTPTAPVASE